MYVYVSVFLYLFLVINMFIPIIPQRQWFDHIVQFKDL